jgi:hypothetical protein
MTSTPADYVLLPDALNAGDVTEEAERLSQKPASWQLD